MTACPASVIMFNHDIVQQFPPRNKWRANYCVEKGLILKVIHLISGGDTGGAKTHVHSLLFNLSKSVDITLICFRDGPFAQEAAELGIDTRVFAGRFFSALDEVASFIKDGGFELIHCHGSRGNLAGALLTRRTGLPVLSTVHSDYKLDYLGRPMAAMTYGLLNKVALRRIRYHIGVSDTMRELLISRGFRRGTTFPIYNGIDFDRAMPPVDSRAFYKRLGFEVCDGDLVIGAAARLDPVKDLSTLICAFAEAKKQHPELKLLIAGEGAERERLSSLAKELGVRDAVCLAGWLDDMDEFYGSIHINALTSISETFPYAITEGAFHRLPTVSSRVGGIPRLVEDGVTGRLFEPGDAAALAQALSELAADAQLRSRLGNAIFERAARDFSMDETCREQRAVYDEILEREHNAGRAGVIICGAYGMGNAGDEAILDAIVDEQRSINPLMPITVLTRDPAGTRERLGVDATHTFNVPSFLRIMGRSILYINGGGSLIQDVTSRRSLWYYLFTLRMAKKRGCRVMMYGCGIGPVTRPAGIESTRRTLDECVDIITLREPDSMEQLRAFGVTKPEIILASDPALTLSPAPEQEVFEALRAAGADPNGKYICFALRLWPGFDEKARVFAAAAKHAYEAHGLTPAFISVNHKLDGEASEKVAKHLDGTPCVFLTEQMSSPLTIGVMGRMEIVVSMRLHGLIFAAGQGLPLVGVSYDPKVTAFLRCVDGGCVELEDLSADRLCSLIDEAAAKRAKPEVLRESVRTLRELEAHNTGAAARLLGKGEK